MYMARLTIAFEKVVEQNFQLIIYLPFTFRLMKFLDMSIIIL